MDEFDKWNNLKKEINKSNNSFNFKEREIFYIKIGKNVGFEEDGKGDYFVRPVIILRKFNSNIFWGIPLTSSNIDKKESIFYFKFYIKNIRNCAIISQLRLFDSKRLLNKLGVISKDDYKLIKQKIIQIIG